MRAGKGGGGTPGGPKVGQRWWGRGPAQIMCENSIRSTEPNGSTLELGGSHIKAELREFVEGDQEQKA
jgi:hypothetical protein